MALTVEEVVADLKAHANPAGVKGMAHFGSRPANSLGLTMPFLRQKAREIKRDHSLALELWATGLHEGRILASMLADPKQVSIPYREYHPFRPVIQSEGGYHMVVSIPYREYHPFRLGQEVNHDR